MRITFWLSLALSLLTLSGTVSAQTTQNPKPVVLGTKQLPGQFGKFGTTYTIGKADPLNFTLISAEYRADRYIGENSVGQTESFVPPKGQKLLVLKYTVQNPSPHDTRLWYMSFLITAVSPDDQNTKMLNHPWIGSSKAYRDVQLKPGEKVTLTAGLFVAGEGETPKLIVQRGSDETAAVVRYDLRGKVAKMATPYSEDGITALDVVKGNLDTYYPWSGSDFKIVGFDPVAEKISDVGTDGDHTQYALKLGFRGVTPVEGRVWYGQFKVFVKTADGDLIEQKPYYRVRRMSSADSFDGAIPVGEEMNLRFIVDLPKNAKASSIKITCVSDPERRSFAFDLPK